MKKEIHPEYHTKAEVACSCGATFDTGSTRAKITVETCSQCHPFYTGKQKLIDSTGRVDRFKKISERAEKTKSSRTGTRTKAEKNAERAEKQQEKAEKAAAA